MRWHRRGFATLLAGLAVLALGTALAPPAGETVSVLVAARAVPAGTTLGSDDLAVAQYPPGLAPPGALTSMDDAVGRVIATGASEAMPIDPATLVGVKAKRPGEVLVSLHFPDDGSRSLIQVGSLINVYAAQPSGGSTLVASRLRIVSITPKGSNSLTGSSDSGLGLVIAANPDQAKALAVVSTSSAISLAVV